MSRVVSLPFRRVPADRSVCESWQAHIGGTAGPLASELPHWDYNVDLRLVRSMTIIEARGRRVRLTVIGLDMPLVA